MEDYLRRNFAVESKRMSEEALMRWRSAVRVDKNPRRRFRMVADLAKRAEAERKRVKLQEADAVKGIALDMSKIKDIDLNYESFEKLYNLRFLKFFYQTHCSGHAMYTPKVHAPHGLKYLPDELRSLYWHGYPLTTLPTDYSLENLVELNLPYSNLEQLWEGIKVAPRLKLLILCNSQKLTSLPDLSYSPLKEIPEDIGCLSSLEVLEVCGNSFGSLPTSMHQLSELKRLLLNNCSMLQSLTKLPSGLQSLEAMNCKQLQSLPDTSELAEVVTQRFIKGYERAFPLSICLPGSVISDWFDYQRIGSLITIQLPRDNRKLVGFALCTVIAFEKYCDDGRGVCVGFKNHYGDTMDFCGSLTVCDTQKHNHTISIYLDHIVQGYYPFSNVTGFISVEFYPQNFDGQPLQGCEVKNCAVCPLYAEEVTETRKFPDETDTCGSGSSRFDDEEMNPHPKIIAERKSTLLIDNKAIPFYCTVRNNIGLLLFYCWCFIFCLFCGIFVVGLLGFLVHHLSTSCEIYLSSHVQNMHGRASVGHLMSHIAGEYDLD
ncbi:hypothetical protein EZV62_017191 [Acer yangbiense]|uniref:Uncharacterized protein n=1 Tax=Acer yangbiense TaxID=1000413 RepID=A0A5C7HGH8_9ROSI|nr:hypothetical protein EZV62_017191 [Acer yangbiense]